MSGHVADHNRRVAVPQLQVVVVITADFAGRLGAGRDIQTLHQRRLLGKQVDLQLTRDLEFLLPPFGLDRVAQQPGMLQSQRHLVGEPFDAANFGCIKRVCFEPAGDQQRPLFAILGDHRNEDGASRRRLPDLLEAGQRRTSVVHDDHRPTICETFDECVPRSSSPVPIDLFGIAVGPQQHALHSRPLGIRLHQHGDVGLRDTQQRLQNGRLKLIRIEGGPRGKAEVVYRVDLAKLPFVGAGPGQRQDRTEEKQSPVDEYQHAAEADEVRQRVLMLQRNEIGDPQRGDQWNQDRDHRPERASWPAVGFRGGPATRAAS